jgi:hypothetical protein
MREFRVKIGCGIRPGFIHQFINNTDAIYHYIRPNALDYPFGSVRLRGVKAGNQYGGFQETVTADNFIAASDGTDDIE